MTVSPIVATLFGCLLVTTAATAALTHATNGLAHWTFEERRRAHASEGRISAPLLARADAPAHEIRIVDFIYTRCPSVCRVLGSEYQQMQQLLMAQPGSAVRLLSMSIDPENDGPSELAQYARTHGARMPYWQVSGSRSPEENQRLRRSLGVVVIPDGMGGLAHNSALHLVDQHGRLLAIFDHAHWRTALALAEEMARERRQ